MNSRQKFLSVMRMEDGDYNGVEVPKVEFGYWAGTIRRWFSQGLKKRQEVPEDISDGIAIMANKNIYPKMEKEGDRNVQPVFGLDQYLTKFPVDYSPRLKEEVIEKTETHIIYKDSYGVLNKNDVAKTSLPLELEHPVKDWQSWEKYKEGYSLDDIEERLPPDWDNLAERLKDRDYPIRLGGTNGGFLGFPRQIMGLQTYLIKLYDDPELIHDICDTFLEFLLAYYGRIIEDIKVDCILIWEDMAGKGGSLISPVHFREFLAPRYRKMVSFAHDMGIDIILTDSDGYVEDLIPLIVETGVTGMYPFERAAGNDLVRIREAFPNFQIMGGIDKRILFSDSNNERIEAELAIASKMLKQGRYIPHIDHFVSQDCTYKNFTYYRDRLNEIIDSFSKRGG
ncbi:MAG: uroporphyrinogen decarboxylase family protein [Candidatus Humimicrobiaceae bacterium]